MINHDTMRKALSRQKIAASDVQINNLLNDLYPNPQCGFGVSGFNVFGDNKSIDAVRQWHHDSTGVVPSLRDTIISERAVRATAPPPPSDHAVCCGCGTYPKGFYTCQTCAAADEHEGPQEHISDWPQLS